MWNNLGMGERRCCLYIPGCLHTSTKKNPTLIQGRTWEFYFNTELQQVSLSKTGGQKFSNGDLMAGRHEILLT